jgi:hypothetical protein
MTGVGRLFGWLFSDRRNRERACSIVSTMSFDPDYYGEPVATLIRDAPLNELGPGRPNRASEAALSRLDVSTAFPGKKVVDTDMADACISGLWLVHDFLDPSHTISQGIHTATGSYWHGMMHRREPDFGNAKYWFRRVGDHPVFEPLRIESADLAKDTRHAETTYLTTQASWDPFRFVDLCQLGLRENGDLGELCRQIARREWQLLFDFCYRNAVAGQ